MVLFYENTETRASKSFGETMNTKEFNLSEKEFYACSPPNSEIPFGRSCLKTLDVKEFIRLLKEEVTYNDFIAGKQVLLLFIDKLAGKSLVEEKP